MSKSSEMLLK